MKKLLQYWEIVNIDRRIQQCQKSTVKLLIIIRQVTHMIRHAYKQRNQYNSTPVQTLLCSLVFIDLTIFFFLSFMNICFDTIASDPPRALMALLFAIMLLDLIAELYFSKKITLTFIFNLTIMVFLVLSWTVENTTTLYLSALVLLRFPQIVHFNQILQDKLRSTHYLFKIYVLLKIIYMLTVVGHVMGCIFYAIDNTLIKQQYFGSLAENPGLYYQGQLLCYTPIYSLSQTNRYLYCMYYIISLLATVAYGDIIPKNPFENAYVCLLLVLATVSAGFIIQQLLIVLSDHWHFRVTSLKKVRYFDTVLTKCTNISNASRIKLAKYLLHVMMTYDIQTPNFSRLSHSLQLRIKKATVTSVSRDINLQKPHPNVEIALKDYGVPSFLADFLLMELQLKYYPSGYLLKHNENFNDSIISFIKLRGQLSLSYGKKFQVRTTVKEKPVLFGWREFILNSKHSVNQMSIQTQAVCELYEISSQTLQALIKREKEQTRNEQNFSKMLESFHICRAKQLASIVKQQKAKIQDKGAFQSYDQKVIRKEKHFFTCWSCGVNSHTLSTALCTIMSLVLKIF